MHPIYWFFGFEPKRVGFIPKIFRTENRRQQWIKRTIPSCSMHLCELITLQNICLLTHKTAAQIRRVATHFFHQKCHTCSTKQFRHVHKSSMTQTGTYSDLASRNSTASNTFQPRQPFPGPFTASSPATVIFRVFDCWMIGPNQKKNAKDSINHPSQSPQSIAQKRRVNHLCKPAARVRNLGQRQLQERGARKKGEPRRKSQSLLQVSRERAATGASTTSQICRRFCRSSLISCEKNCFVLVLSAPTPLLGKGRN